MPAGSAIKAALAAMSAAALGLALPALASACSCVPVDAKRELRKADGAVIARIVDRVPRSETSADYILRVREVFKGRIKPRSRLTVRSAADGAACGLEDFGEAFGIFLGRSRGIWHSNLCRQTERRALRRAAAGRSAKTSPCPS